MEKHRNFNPRFKEYRRDCIYAEGKSRFSDHVMKEGQDMKTIEETISIIYIKKKHGKSKETRRDGNTERGLLTNLIQ